MSLNKYRNIDLSLLIILGIVAEAILDFVFGNVENGCIQFVTIAILVIAVTRWRKIGFIVLPIMMFVPWVVDGFGLDNLIRVICGTFGLITAGLIVLSYRRDYENKYKGINPLAIVFVAQMTMVVTRSISEIFLGGNFFTTLGGIIIPNMLGMLFNFIFIKFALSGMLYDVKDELIKQSQNEDPGMNL